MEHLPVLADEVTFLLRPRRGGWVVDGTIGMGGHAERLLEAGGEGTRLLGLDADPDEGFIRGKMKGGPLPRGRGLLMAEDTGVFVQVAATDVRK